MVVALRFVTLFGSETTELPADGDAGYYGAWAERVARGEWTDGQAFFGLPLYPWFLGVLRWLSGPGSFAPLFVQSLADGLIASLISSAVACILQDAPDPKLRRAVPAFSILASAFWAAFVPASVFSMTLIPATFSALAYFGIARWCAINSRPVKPIGALGLGGALGMAGLLVANALALAPLVAFRVWQCRGADRSLSFVGLTLGLVLGTSPAWAYHRFVAREPVLLSAHGGINFYVGNFAGATGYPVMPPGFRASQRGMMLDAQRMAETSVGKNLTRAEASAFWTARAWEEIGADRTRWVRLLGTKVVNYWNAFSFDDTGTIAAWRALSLLPAGLPFAAIAFPALALGIFAFAQFPRARWLGAAAGLHFLSVLPVFVTERYRFVSAPSLLVLAFVGGAACWQSALARPRWTLIVAIVTTSLATFLVFLPRSEAARNNRSDDYSAARALYAAGQFAESAGYLQRVLERAPRNPEVHLLDGNLRLEANDVAGARAAFRRVLSLDPNHVRAWNNLGLAELQSASWPAAIEAFSAAVALEPGNAKSHYLLARALAGAGDRNAALREATLAVTLAPASADFQSLRSQLEGQNR